MATLIDKERQDSDSKESQSKLEISDIKDFKEESVEVKAEEPSEDEFPEKYKGKSLKDLVQMHQEAEKVIGKQGHEVGDLRGVVDKYIETELKKRDTKENDSDEEVDFWAEPEKATLKLIENHPLVKQAELDSAQYRKSSALAKLERKFPDMKETLRNEKFADWVQGSEFRIKLFQKADSQADYDAADELFSTWEERQKLVKETVTAEVVDRSNAVKTASTGNATGSVSHTGKNNYRRSDIIKLMMEDPDRYASLHDEILAAYAEGRVI